MVTVDVDSDVTQPARRRPRSQPGDTGSAGRINPFTPIPNWVIFSSVSSLAKTLYCILSAHVNTLRAEQGDRRVWPSRATLAAHLGKSVRSVDGYMNELEKLGAVEVVHRKAADGGNLSNHYIVYELPPEGYRGSSTVGEAGDAVKGESAISAARDGAQPVASPPAKDFVGEREQLHPNYTKKNYKKEELQEGALGRGGGCVRGDADAPARGAGTTTTRPQAPKPECVPITPGSFPLDGSCRAWLGSHRPDLTEEDVAAQHAAFVDYHYEGRRGLGEWFKLWRGWMGRAHLRVPEDWEPDAAGVVWAAGACPDVDVDEETAVWVSECAYAGRKFPDVGAAWREAMRDAQACCEEDAA